MPVTRPIQGKAKPPRKLPVPHANALQAKPSPGVECFGLLCAPDSPLAKSHDKFLSLKLGEHPPKPPVEHSTPQAKAAKRIRYEWALVPLPLSDATFQVELAMGVQLFVLLQRGVWTVILKNEDGAELTTCQLQNCNGIESAKNKAVRAAVAYFDRQLAVLIRVGVSKGSVR